MTDNTEQQGGLLAVEVALQSIINLNNDGEGARSFVAQRGCIARMKAIARDGMTALRLASVSSASAEGWKLVPTTLTAGMAGAWQGGGRPFSSDEQAAHSKNWQDSWRRLLAASPEPVPATNQAGEVEWRGMEDAPRDGSIIELRSALRLNRSEFRAAYMRPIGLVAKAWVPVRGQSVGDLPWKDHEVEAWRPALATQPATSQEGEEARKDTIAFVQEWMMSGDHEPDQWHRDFAAAIDARRPTEQSIFDAINEDCGTDATAWIIARLAAAATPTPPTLSEDLRECVFDAAHVFERLRDLTPLRANESTAEGFHGAVRAIAGAALGRMDAALARAQVKAS